MQKKQLITVARGDGIGPEIMDAVLKVLDCSGAMIEAEFIDIGEKIYKAGYSTGITKEAWDSLRRTKVFLKGPITTPQGGGFESLNVAIRKTLGLYASVRKCVSYDPIIKTKYPNMNVVIIRENEEDLYIGIEHQQTPEVVQSLKLITRPGTEKVVRYAFEYARLNNRNKVSCFTKDNIIKLSDGLFHKVFNEVSNEYPDITSEHLIIDAGMSKMVDNPNEFDVIVLPNMYGVTASHIAGQMAGSVGLTGSANIGNQCAMFEAIHGSAPRRAGQGIVNPSGLLHGAIMMLVHIGQQEVAARIHNAWLKTIEDGIFTYDIAKENSYVGTVEFADAVIERLGKSPTRFQPVKYRKNKKTETSKHTVPLSAKDRNTINLLRELEGVDIFIFNKELTSEELGLKLEKTAGPELKLIIITNRGIKVYPNGFPESFTTDHWRCRFYAEDKDSLITNRDIRNLQKRIEDSGLEWIKIENLYKFDGKRGYTLGPGQ